MKKLLFLLWFYPIAAFAQTEYATQNNIRYYNDITYQSDTYLSEKCLLDVYYPKNAKGFATLLWFHGGGLTDGNKFIPEALKNKGFCIIAVGYRLSPKVKAEQCIMDAAAATAWAFRHISEYGGDPTLIFESGHSAGGYLAEMVTLDKKWLSKFNIDANQIAGLIPLSGQAITHFTIRKEKGIPEKQPIIDALAPLYHVRADAPPVLLITGDRELELLGRYEENAYLARMMKVAGHQQTKLLELGGYGHDMMEPAFPLVVNEINRIVASKKH